MIQNYDFNVEDKRHFEASKKFRDEELEELPHEDTWQAQTEHSESLGFGYMTISKRLKASVIIETKNIGCRTSWSRETSNGVLSHVNSYFNGRKGKVFCIVPCPVIVTTDYHLFRSIACGLVEKHIYCYEDTIK